MKALNSAKIKKVLVQQSLPKQIDEGEEET